MGTFYQTTLGIDGATVEELNSCALRGGVWGEIGYGYACRGELPKERHGYTFQWIGTGGMGNAGKIVLKGRTPLAREYLREGVVREIMSRFPDLAYVEASRLADAARTTQYGREEAVQKLAVETRHLVNAWDAFDDAGRPGYSTDKWSKVWGIERLSYWRLRAAQGLVRAMNK
jgi:hypothetical protein